MAKIKVTTSVTIDSLGKWQQPILEAVRKKLGGAKAAYAVLPMGKAALVVEWQGFSGHDVTERQEMVRASIERLGCDASKRVSMILTLTPDEANGMKDA